MKIWDCLWTKIGTPFVRDLGKAAGAKKQSESQKGKALWTMKAALDREDEFYGLAEKRQHLGKELDEIKDPITALDKASKCAGNQYQG